MSVAVQVFGRRNNGLSTYSDGRRPKSAKAGNRGLGTAVMPSCMYGIGAAVAPMRATFARATTIMAGSIASASAAAR
jgi:hypothetical protein